MSLNSAQSFYAVVSVSSSSSSVNTDIDVKADDASMKPPMDIICVLDTSGSMSSDNKLVNLKHAGKCVSKCMNY